MVLKVILEQIFDFLIFRPFWAHFLKNLLKLSEIFQKMVPKWTKKQFYTLCPIFRFLTWLYEKFFPKIFKFLEFSSKTWILVYPYMKLIKNPAYIHKLHKSIISFCLLSLYKRFEQKANIRGATGVLVTKNRDILRIFLKFDICRHINADTVYKKVSILCAYSRNPTYVVISIWTTMMQFRCNSGVTKPQCFI